MLHRHLVRVLLPAAILTAHADAPASAEVLRHYHGTTPQGYDLKMTGAPQGNASHVEVGYRVRCRRHDFTLHDTLFGGPPRYANGRRAFSLVEEESTGGPKQLQGELEVAMTGRRVTPRGRPASEYWQGTLEVELSLLDPDDRSLRERCRTRRMRWKAYREGYGVGRWTMTSDSGDWIGQGSSYDLDSVVAYGDARSIFVYGDEDPDASIPAFDAQFHAPRGRRLLAGGRYGGFEISGPHRGCDETYGEFTIERARYDRRRRLRDLRLSFTHRCDTDPETGPALRGTITFRSRRR